MLSCSTSIMTSYRSRCGGQRRSKIVFILVECTHDDTRNFDISLFVARVSRGKSWERAVVASRATYRSRGPIKRHDYKQICRYLISGFFFWSGAHIRSWLFSSMIGNINNDGFHWCIFVIYLVVYCTEGK